MGEKRFYVYVVLSFVNNAVLQNMYPAQISNTEYTRWLISVMGETSPSTKYIHRINYTFQPINQINLAEAGNHLPDQQENMPSH